jgi:hypothetical protein
VSSPHTPDGAGDAEGTADAEGSAGTAGTGVPAQPVAKDPRPRRGSRRVTTPPPEGSDPSPLPEPSRSNGRENDERMRAEKPPHY